MGFVSQLLARLCDVGHAWLGRYHLMLRKWSKLVSHSLVSMILHHFVCEFALPDIFFK